MNQGNNNQETHIFCGNAKKFNEKGMSIQVCLDDIPKEHIREHMGKKWVTLTAYELKEPRENKTHSLRVDTYKPKPKQ